LGVLHPDYLLESLTSKQLAEWDEYEKLEPFGQRHKDQGLGILGSIIAQAFFKSNTAFTPDQFRVRTRLDLKKPKLVDLKSIFQSLRDRQRAKEKKK